MTNYNPPLSDINFCIRHLANIKDILSFDAFEGMEPEDLEQVLEEAGKFSSDVVAPTNIPTDQQGCRLEGNTVHVADVLADVHRQFVENGWQAVAGDPEYDGMGLPSTIAFATAEMLQSANMAYSLLPMLTRDAVAALEEHGSDELKQQYLPRLTSGEWSATMNLTEPQAGSDLSAVACRAERDGDQFRIRGSKIYITWGDHELAGNVIHTVLARIDGAPEGVRGISMFLVPKFVLDENGEPGERNDVYATALEHKMGIHGSPTAVMNFGDNEGAVGYLIGEENKGLSHMFTMMNHARMEVGLQGVAISERAYQLARSYANERVQGRVPGQEGRAPIIHHGDVRRMLMLMRSQLEAMRALSYTAASMDDIEHNAADADVRASAGKRLSLLTPIVKGWCTEISEQVTSLGIQIHGGMGFVEETGAAQYYRDARILTIYEGTTGIQAGDFAGRKILADEGHELTALIVELRELCDSMQSDERLAPLAQAVRDGLAQLEEGMQWLIANGTSSPAAMGSASFNLLMLAGTVLGGAYLAKAAAIAISESSSASESFGKNKLATAAFYCAHVLPRAHGFLAAAMSDADLTMAIAADSF